MILRPLIGTKAIFALNMDYGHEAAHWWELPLTTLPHIATIGPAQKNILDQRNSSSPSQYQSEKELYQAREIIEQLRTKTHAINQYFELGGRRKLNTHMNFPNKPEGTIRLMITINKMTSSQKFSAFTASWKREGDHVLNTQ